MSDLSGKTFGKYQLRERLGRGGMADVYKAYQPGMDRFVAVKLLHGHLADSENFIQRFRREAQSVGQLRHPNILQVIDFDVEGDVYFMVMEYIKGDTLKAYIQEKGALSPDEALRIAEQLADALAYAHSHQMIHRDIKPANVMFTDKLRNHPVLTDFGIARIISDSGLTASGAFVGTPAYMPPEAGRSEPVDERSDIYSLGIMIYEMLTGKVPFDADTPFAVVMKHVNEPLPSIRRFNAQLPDSVERILLKALSKDPTDRFQTAADFKIALKKARESLPAERPTADSDAFSTNVESLTPATKVGAKRVLDTAATVIETDVPVDDKTVLKNVPAAAASKKFSIAKYGGAVVAFALIFVIGFLAFGNGDDGDDSSSSESEQAGVLPTQTDESISALPSEEPASSPQPASATDSDTVEATQVAENSSTNTDDTDSVTDVSAADDFADEGFEYFADEDYEAAIEAFTTALELDPENVDAFAGRADSHLALENYEDAIADYTQIINRNPDDVDALSNRGDAYLYIGNTDAALTDLNTALEIQPENPELYITRGWVNYNVDNLEAAESDFTRAVELAPQSSEAHFGRGIIYHELGQSDQALEDFSQVIELDTTEPATRADAYAERAEIFAENEDTDSALGDLNTAIEINPEEAYYFEARAFLLLNQGDIDAAIADLETAVGLESLNAEFHRELGDLYFDQERPRDALSQYQVYLVLEGDSADVDIVARVQRLTSGDDGFQVEDRPRFTSYLPDDDPEVIIRANEIDFVQYSDSADAAIETATQALQDYPDNPIFLTLRSDLYLSNNQYDEALTDAETAQVANPDHPAGYIALSRYYFRAPESDYDRAFEYAETAFELAPEHQEVVIHYANSLQLIGRNDEAIEMYGRAEELGAPLRPVLTLRGNLQFDIGRYAAAAEDFARYLTISDDLDVRYRLMGAYMLANQPEQALLVAIDGLGQNNEANYFANISYVAYQVGDDEQATQWANDALVRDGGQFPAYYTLALIAVRNEDFDTAIENFDLLAELETWQYDWPFLNQQYGHTLQLDRARLARVLGDDVQAEALYTQAIEDSYWYLPNLERGRMYFEQGRINEAFDDYFYALTTAEGNDTLTQQILDEFFAYGPEIVGRSIFRLMNDNVEASAQLATRALETFPNDPLILVGRANAYLVMGDFDSALADVQTAIDTNPEAPIGYAGLVDYYRVTDQYDEMLEAAERAREIGPEDPGVMLAYARALRATDTGSQVLAMYQVALDAGADAEIVLRERAEYALEIGEFQEALESARQLTEISPNFDTITFAISIPLWIGQNAEAYGVALQYAELEVGETRQAQYLVTLAYVAYRAGENDQSREWLTTAFELEEDIATGIYLDSLLLVREGQFDAAIERLQQVEAREPWEYEDSFFNVRFGHTLNVDFARIYRAMGEVEMARERYQELPYNTALYVERAEFYIEIGEPELARQDLLTAQQINEETFNDEMLSTRIDELLQSLGRAPTPAP